MKERIQSGVEGQSALLRYFVRRIEGEIKKQLFGNERPVDEEEDEGWSRLDFDGWVARIEPLAGLMLLKLRHAGRMKWPGKTILKIQRAIACPLSRKGMRTGTTVTAPLWQGIKGVEMAKMKIPIIEQLKTQSILGCTQQRTYLRLLFRILSP